MRLVMGGIDEILRQEPLAASRPCMSTVQASTVSTSPLATAFFN